ncbi:hypothetical protein RIVM261_071030 [Rivularia sp. IAM M-261]|nr:hypothetical protein RIVM261_071030 [Rivularia sp. IAM M-261]
MNEYKRFFNHIPGNLEQSNYRIFEPDSKAEILYWFSREDISNIQKDEFIKALINFDDGCGNFYRHRAYFLAAEALRYFPESYLGDVIVNQLLNWSYVYFSWQIIPKPLQAAAREVLKVTDPKRVVEAFTNLLHTTTSRVTLRQASVELGKLDAGNKTAIAALILLLDVSKDEHTQQRVIDSLASIGHANENVVQALISFLTKTSNVSLCWNIMTALGAVAKGNQQVIIALSERLKNNACHNDNDYFKTAVTLWELNPDNLVAKDSFVKVLAVTNDFDLVSIIADYLLKIDFDSQAVIAVLSQKLAEHESEHIRITCASHLAKLDFGNPTAKQTLIQIISNSKDSCLEYQAFRYLLQFFPSDEDTVYIFGTTQISENRCFFGAIAKNIEENGSTNQISIDFLIFNMHESPSKDDCHTAINLLRYVDLTDDTLGRNKIITALIAFLQKNQGDIICLSASDTLLTIDPNNQTAINLLVEVLEVNRSEWVCRAAISMLLQVGYYNEKIVEKLIDSVSTQKSCCSDDMWKVSRYLELIKDNQNYTNVLDTIVAHYLEFFHNCLTPRYEEEDIINPWQFFSYSYHLVELSEKLLHVLQPQHLPQVVTSLKSHLNKSSYNSTSYRYEAIYNLIYHCAQNMSYVDFCHAWQH